MNQTSSINSSNVRLKSSDDLMSFVPRISKTEFQNNALETHRVAGDDSRISFLYFFPYVWGL